MRRGEKRERRREREREERERDFILAMQRFPSDRLL